MFLANIEPISEGIYFYKTLQSSVSSVRNITPSDVIIFTVYHSFIYLNGSGSTVRKSVDLQQIPNSSSELVVISGVLWRIPNTLFLLRELVMVRRGCPK